MEPVQVPAPMETHEAGNVHLYVWRNGPRMVGGADGRMAGSGEVISGGIYPRMAEMVSVAGRQVAEVR